MLVASSEGLEQMGERLFWSVNLILMVAIVMFGAIAIAYVANGGS
jgi:hypothetical protein